MNTTEERIHRLEGLLERVRRNARRVPGAFAATPEPAPAVARPSPPRDEAADTRLNASPEPPPAMALDAELLEEDDIIDITPDDELEPSPAPRKEMGSFDLERFTEDDEPPASSRRPKVAGSMNEALAGAAADLEEREAPLKTPPPESGRQIATAPPGPLQPPPADLSALRSDRDVDELLGPGPTQPGATAQTSAAARESDAELEATLPEPAAAAGEYKAGLAPPADARFELEQRRPIRPDLPGADPELTSQVYERASLSPKPPAAFIERPAAPEPSTFLELLDASLGLRAD